MVDGDQAAESFGQVTQLDYCHGSQPSCPARLPPGCQSPGAVCLPRALPPDARAAGDGDTADPCVRAGDQFKRATDRSRSLLEFKVTIKF